MDKILKLLIEKFNFLYNDCEFRFVDSLVEDTCGGSAYLILAKDKLDICFIISRDGLMLEFGNNSNKTASREWFSFDIVRQFITGEEKCSGKPDEKNAFFLKEHIYEIIDSFSTSNFKDTKNKLRSLERKRAKKLFKKR